MNQLIECSIRYRKNRREEHLKTAGLELDCHDIVTSSLVITRNAELIISQQKEQRKLR